MLHSTTHYNTWPARSWVQLAEHPHLDNGVLFLRSEGNCSLLEQQIWCHISHKVVGILQCCSEANYQSYTDKMWWLNLVNSLRPRRNEQHFADDIFKRIFLNENVWISTKISLKFVPKGPINNITALVQILAWRRPGDEPSSEAMMVSLPTHICVTRPQWVNRALPANSLVKWIPMKVGHTSNIDQIWVVYCLPIGIGSIRLELSLTHFAQLNCLSNDVGHFSEVVGADPVKR